MFGGGLDSSTYIYYKLTYKFLVMLFLVQIWVVSTKLYVKKTQNMQNYFYIFSVVRPCKKERQRLDIDNGHYHDFCYAIYIVPVGVVAPSRQYQPLSQGVHSACSFRLVLLEYVPAAHGY